MSVELMLIGEDLYWNFPEGIGRLSLTSVMPDLPEYDGNVLAMDSFKAFARLPVPQSLEKFLNDQISENNYWVASIYLLAKTNYSNQYDSYIMIRTIEKPDIQYFADESMFVVNMSSNTVLSVAGVASHYHMIDHGTKNSYSLRKSDEGFVRLFESSAGHFVVSGFEERRRILRMNFEIDKETGRISE